MNMDNLILFGVNKTVECVRNQQRATENGAEEEKRKACGSFMAETDCKSQVSESIGRKPLLGRRRRRQDVANVLD
ncbi:hypothetical protein AAFF_G00254200 [Aldrovandia affinis]|uniref:Uncharacterized protein n=1 Tax=Aldrovandia affinis TaxID=143900 RepID=A0AAD7RCN2_9TELE|nr:hypothetical protein AAFF_G00254200 [Aldrovandia affinis]